MDEYIDHFLSPALWSDANPNETSYWGYCESVQLDDSPISTINSNQCLESLATQDTPTVLINGESDQGLMQVLLSAQSQSNDQGLVNPGHYQKQLEDVSNMSKSSLSFTEPGLVGCNEPFDLHSSIETNTEMLSSIPKLWPPPTHEEDNVNNDSEFMRNGYDVLQYDDLSASVARKEKLELYNNFFSVTSAGLNSPPQATQTISGSSNGTVKPRPRARRGQATDPHSIAERLRREKIAERMRNLQELVPNSNKTDKVSMLDEILDYVKFLQLQVKVLSTSRLGTAGAVVITDSQTEVLPSLPSDGQSDDPQSPDQAALEQEIIKLMDSSMSMAMQYLQSKGLCLMPTSLAASISDAKTSSSSSIVSDGNSCSNKDVKQEVTKELKPKT